MKDENNKTQGSNYKRAKTTKNGSRRDKGDFPGKRKPQSVPLGNYDTRACASAIRDSSNDAAWYSKFPQLLKDAGSLNYANINGILYESTETGSATTIDSLKWATPGIMVLRVAPTFGVSKNGQSAVNMTARSTFAFMRKNNSGAVNYTASDYMTYILAMSSLYAHHAEMIRLYGLFNTYSWASRYVAEGIVKALGYDYDDFSRNLADFRAYINVFATYLNRFNVPKDMAIYDRHAWIPLHLYKDAGQNKSQLYAMQFEYLYKWDGYTFETGSALIPTKITSDGLITFQQLRDFSEDLVSGMLLDSDISIMSGDTWKAWGDSGLRTVVGITSDYSTVPTYDEVVLVQIHNTFIPGIVDPYGNRAEYASAKLEDVFNSFCIKQDENMDIIWNPCIMDPVASMYGISGIMPKMILDSGFDTPTPEFNAEATRLKAFPDLSDYDETLSDSYRGYHLAACGTELPVSMTIYTFADPKLGNDFIGIPLFKSYRTEIVISDAAFDLWASSATVFDWHPILFADQTIKEEDYSAIGFKPFGELFNWMYLEPETLRKMHEACLLSLLLTETMTTVV